MFILSWKYQHFFLELFFSEENCEAVMEAFNVMVTKLSIQNKHTVNIAFSLVQCF